MSHLSTIRTILVNNRLVNIVQKRFRYGKPNVRHHWPEPLTQQTLKQFLHDINYFEEPRKWKDIGLQSIAVEQPKVNSNQPTKQSSAETKEIDEILNLLSEDVEPPELDYNDLAIDPKQLVSLATTAGIFRDLFSSYSPNREYIHFTEEQAKNLDKLVPYYWITDQPFARVRRRPEEVQALNYFEPTVGVKAKFVASSGAHVSYHGNIIPAAEALVKPSITLSGNLVSPLNDDNWSEGGVKLTNFNNDQGSVYYTVALLNLDHLHQNQSNLHWMLANLSARDNKSVQEVCEYLPVHGIRGFGYSRYVFLVFQHSSKLDKDKFKISNFSLEQRSFNALDFIEQNKEINLLPVGLSWFQTTWDDSSNEIFHKYLEIKAPVYELIQAKPEKLDMIDPKYPGKIPFNIFLDHQRDKKEINEQVLLERLKTVDPFDYKDQYVPPKVPHTIFEDEKVPSWMKNVLFKKKNRIGYWRGLRPASASLPLDNNADLDHPIRPLSSSKRSPPGWPNKYVGKVKPKLLKDLPYSKPVNEHTNTYIQEDHDVHLEEVRKMMQKLEPKEIEKESN